MPTVWTWKIESEKDNPNCFYYESEYSAYLVGIIEEYGLMSEEFYLTMRYERPSNYHICVMSLPKIDWNNPNERTKWLRKHKKSREQFIRDDKCQPRLVVTSREVPVGTKTKTLKDTLDEDFYYDVDSEDDYNSDTSSECSECRE